MSIRAYVLVLVSTLVTLGVIVKQVRQRKLRAKYALLWLAVGVALLPLALVPDLLDRISALVGVAYGPALLLVIGLAFFALLSLHFSYELSRLEERTRVLAEEAALMRERLEELEHKARPQRSRPERSRSA